MKESKKHKTVGVSLSPELRGLAADRARILGLSFSRYVAACIEKEQENGSAPATLSELREPEVDVLEAIEKGTEYGIAKAASIAFEDDVEEFLKLEDWCFERFAKVGNLRTDFLITEVRPAQNGDQEQSVRIAMECKHSLKDRYAVTLGQAIVLRSQTSVDAVVLCVPYLRGVDSDMMSTFEAQGIRICTPDTIGETLKSVLKLAFVTNTTEQNNAH